MVWSPKLTLLVLAGAFVALYVSAGAICIRALLRRIRKRPAPQMSRARRWLRRVVLAVAAVGIVCLAYAYFIEPYWLETTHVRVQSSKLPAGAGPIRIVHISDLHCDATVKLEDELVDAIAAAKPDLIAFTGDAINYHEARETFRKCMTRLAGIAPTFAVKGNWDVWLVPEEGLFEGMGVIELDGGGVELQIRGATVWVAGASVGPGAPEKIAVALDAAPPGALKIVLHHWPREIYVANEHGADLYLCGHTHGGQVALPFYGAIVTLAKFGKRFEAGLYHEGGTSMYVSRGVGMEGGTLTRLRFFARPEMTIIEVVPTSGTRD
jgi:uncharacterized protein